MVNWRNKHYCIKVEKVMGFSVFSDHLSKIRISNKQPKVLNTISPNSYGLCTKNKLFDNALRSSDYLVLDGVYFALASLLLKGRNIKRNQGPDVFFHFMDRLNKIGGKAFFLGSSNKTLELIRIQASIRYPNVDIYTLSPPFADVFTDEEEQAMIDEINEVKPDIVFVGMTCPKQEIWSVRNKYKLHTGLIISIGNVFDWFAGTQKPIHPIWFTLRVGWLVRIFLRPEIFRRNIGNQLTFFLHLLLVVFLLKKEPEFVKSKN